MSAGPTGLEPVASSLPPRRDGVDGLGVTTLLKGGGRGSDNSGSFRWLQRERERNSVPLAKLRSIQANFKFPWSKFSIKNTELDKLDALTRGGSGSSPPSPA
ncbi:MAG: hypothetical protein E6K95_01090 [Thaumarchaeota archaeon]|nr:MAG: hypothetical protein E6K95_01090 [Nitrososphaerota archaeon]